MAPAIAHATEGSERERSHETRVLLADARSVVLRGILPSDEPGLHDFHDALCESSVRNRFFLPHEHLTSHEAHRFTTVEGHRRGAVVAADDQGIVGVGRFEPTADPRTAELGLVVADAYQGIGLGSVLLGAVCRVAWREGYARLVADVLSSNGRMLRLLVASGYRRRVSNSGGVTTVTLFLGEVPVRSVRPIGASRSG